MPARHRQLDLDVQLCFPLYAASRAVTRAYGPLLAEVGLTYPQYLTMLALWSDPDTAMTVGELGRRLRLDSGTLTPLLKRLERMGHVRRTRDPDDERRVLLELTDQGRALEDAVAHVPVKLLQVMRLEPDGAAQLRRLLDDLLQQLDSTDADAAS